MLHKVGEGRPCLIQTRKQWRGELAMNRDWVILTRRGHDTKCYISVAIFELRIDKLRPRKSRVERQIIFNGQLKPFLACRACRCVLCKYVVYRRMFNMRKLRNINRIVLCRAFCRSSRVGGRSIVRRVKERGYTCTCIRQNCQDRAIQNAAPVNPEIRI